jgi:hypothetical protein
MKLWETNEIVGHHLGDWNYSVVYCDAANSSLMSALLANGAQTNLVQLAYIIPKACWGPPLLLR